MDRVYAGKLGANMTNEQAIKIIQNEYKCVDRECDIERSCGKCPYMIPTKEPILQAYDMAIKALSSWEEYSNKLWKEAYERGKTEALTQGCVGSTQKHVGNALDMRCDDAISLTKEAYSDLCLRASKADDLQRALDMEKGAYNALVKNIQCNNAVSRDAVIAWFCNQRCGCGCVDRKSCPILVGIRELPSVTQKSGKWITKPHVYGVAYCSECDFELKIDDTNYCPNCGAKMESEV